MASRFIESGIVGGTSVQTHLNFILFVFFLTCSLSIVLSFCLLRAVLAFSYTSGQEFITLMNSCSGGCQVMVFERLVMAVSESLPICVVLAIAMKILVTAHLADITTRRSVQEQRNLGFSLESSSSSIM